MSDEFEEAKWTAYVLNELTPGERAALDAELAGSPSTREELELFREATELLEEQFEEDARFRLTQSQLDRVFGDQSVQEIEPIESIEPSTISKLVAMANHSIWRLAAVVAVIFMVGALLLPDRVGNSADGQQAGFSQPSDSHGEPGVLSGIVEPSLNVAEGPGAASLLLGHGSADETSVPDGALVGEAIESVPWTPLAVSQDAVADGPVYSHPFIPVSAQPLVNCSVDIGSTAYDDVRRSIWNEQLPLQDAVRVEELINYFTYDYAGKETGDPLQLVMEATTCPWNSDHRLVQIGLRGGDRVQGSGLPVRIILLVDGTELRRTDFDRAALLQALTALRGELEARDVMVALDGSQLDGAVIQIAESDQSAAVLEQLATIPADGGVDIGVSHQWLLSKIISELDGAAQNEVILVLGGGDRGRAGERTRILNLLREAAPVSVGCSILGVGEVLGQWADAGFVPGNKEFMWRSVSTMAQANHFSQKLFDRRYPPIAREVKMQLEFNQEKVRAYRELGAGSSGLIAAADRPRVSTGQTVNAGQEVTTLFEVIPARPDGGTTRDNRAVSLAALERNQVRTQNMLTVKLNYRLVADNQRVREEHPFVDRGAPLADASENLKFSASVAAYGLLLTDAPFRGRINHYGVLELAQESLGEDTEGYRREFIDLVKRTVKLILKRGGRVSG